MRPHLSLDVRNVPVSVAFYQKIFGVAPQKQTHDYAKFDLTQPALNFSLISSTGRLSSVDHLGIEVESVENCHLERTSPDTRHPGAGRGEYRLLFCSPG